MQVPIAQMLGIPLHSFMSSHFPVRGSLISPRSHSRLLEHFEHGIPQAAPTVEQHDDLEHFTPTNCPLHMLSSIRVKQGPILWSAGYN